MNRVNINAAIARIRRNDDVIPDDVLEFMKAAAHEKLSKIANNSAPYFLTTRHEAIKKHVESYLHGAWSYDGQPVFFTSDLVAIIEAWERKEHPELKAFTIHETLDKNTPVMLAGDTRERVLKSMREFAEQEVAQALKEREGKA